MNILQSIKALLADGAFEKLANHLGEDRSNLGKGFNMTISTVLGALLAKNDSSNLFSLLKDASSLKDRFTQDHLDVEGIQKNDVIHSISNKLFGDTSSEVAHEISKESGIKSSSAKSLLPLVTGLVSSYLGTKIKTEQLDASKFFGFLNTEKNAFASYIPSGLLGSLGLLGLLPNLNASKDEKSGGFWLLPLLGVALLAALAWFFLGKGCNMNTKSESTTTTTTTTVTETTTTLVKGSFDSIKNTYIYDTGVESEIKLANGTVLKVGNQSTEYKLWKFLSESSSVVDTVNKSNGWIVLDRVYFETGKNILTPESQIQLKNIAEILKNYPEAKVKLGGYTDNDGDQTFNVKLSGERAKVAQSELQKLGVLSTNLRSEGYGPAHPVCPSNDTKACKAQNRRVDIRVEQK